MARKPRCIQPDSLVDITCRTIGGLFLLRPSEEVNEIIRGILARYARIHEMKVIFWVCLSNHAHGILHIRDPEQLALFMRDVNREIAKKIGPLQGWHRKLWYRRYDAIPIADEEASMIERLTYMLSQSVKENLCEAVADWPGLHAAHHIATGEPIRGIWRDSTLEGRQKRCGRKLDPSLYLFEETLELTKLPCWAHLSDEDYRGRVAEIVRDIEKKAAEKRELEGRSCLGRDRILQQDPLGAPKSSACSPKPLFHAVSKKAREAMKEYFKAFFDAYRIASAELRGGKLNTVFPDHAFPPALPFFYGARAGPTSP